jgi:carboxymethylenebutenolidase
VQAEAIEHGHLVRPDGGPHPGIVMIHDVWGLAEHTRDLAGRLAREGFAVLAVDLYRRKGKVEIRDPGAWIRDLSDAQVLADVQAAADFLAQGAASGRKLGVTGFCMGGMYALLAACSCEGLAAAVPFYGMLSYRGEMLEGKPGRAPLDAVAELRCPLLAFFGEQDPFIPLTQVELLEERLKGVEPASEVVVYPGAGHAFMNDTRPDAHRPGAAADAWTRTVTFFREQLEPPGR